MRNYREVICQKFGTTTSLRIENMVQLLVDKYGKDWKDDVEPDDLAETIVTQALTRDEWGNMDIESAEELKRWVCESFLGLSL